MPTTGVLLLQSDPASYGRVMQSVGKQFLNVEAVSAASELGTAIARLRAPLAIVDLELIRFEELAELCAEFPSTAVVCVHRLADESMWTQSLALGAVDCCLASEVPKILQASDRYVATKQLRKVSAA